MNKALLTIVAVLATISPPAFGARTAVVPTTHPTKQVYEAYRGGSGSANRSYLGYAGSGWEVINAVPGVLSIEPGPAWANYVGAAQLSPAVNYSIKNVVLEKRTPTAIQCADVYSEQLIQQQGTRNIRLWWPLMYEAAGTTWTLTILYGTTEPYDDDGPTGPNRAGYVHTEIWQWQLDVTLDSMKSLMALFHELPLGKSQVPLISDDAFYEMLQLKLDEVTAAVMAFDSVEAGLALGEFEMLLMDRCLSTLPARPNPAGASTGVANTMENPACCKLLTDAEYLGFKLGIYQPRK